MRELAGLIAIALVTATGVARAEVVGAPDLGTAGAFDATSADVSGMRTNPAALSTVDGFALRVGLAGVHVTDPANGTHHPTFFEHDGAIDAYVAGRLGALALGVAAVPVWQTSEPVSFGVTRRVFGVSLLPSASVRLADWLAVGVGVQVIHCHLEFSIPAEFEANDAASGAGTTTGAGLSVGMRASLMENRLVLGAAYRGPVTGHHSETASTRTAYAVEGGVGFKPSEALVVGVLLGSYGPESATVVASREPFPVLEPSFGALAVRLGLEWALAEWLRVRSGTSLEFHGKGTYRLPMFSYMRTPSSIIHVEPDSVLGLSLGLGFVLPSSVQIDLDGLWLPQGPKEPSVTLGLSVAATG